MKVSELLANEARLMPDDPKVVFETKKWTTVFGIEKDDCELKELPIEKEPDKYYQLLQASRSAFGFKKRK